MFGAREPGSALMDIHFYHGDENALITTQTWDDAYLDPPEIDATAVYILPVHGDDEDVIFYSPRRHEVAHHHYPHGTHVSWYWSDRLVLTYTSAAGNALFDATTGVVHQRDCEFGSFSLGEVCAIGEDEATATLHAYSGLSGEWSTCQADGDCYYRSGGRVSVGYRDDKSRYWAFGAEDGSWAELVAASPQGGNHPDMGQRVILVRDGDRLHAYTPDTWTAVPDEGGEPGRPPSLGEALAAVSCHPNPFNARLTVSFELPYAADVTIELFDPRGRRVARLIEGLQPAGTVCADWITGRAPSGVYLVRVDVEGRTGVIKVVLAK
jgi:hypothetical protein